MRIVINSITFWPNVGGLENIMAGLAAEWTRLGHSVIVFTKVPQKEQLKLSYEVIRNGSFWQLTRAVADSDVFIEANMSLYTFPLGLLFKKKWYISHHLPYIVSNSWKGHLKNFLSRFSNNISVSNYVASTLKGKSFVVPNFYNEQFRRLVHVERSASLVFVGRLVSDKGCDVLIDALHILKKRNLLPRLTVVGDGPEKDSLKAQASTYDLLTQIEFTGALTGEALVQLLNQHKVLVVPSKWPEPFGIVALEGMATGCVIVHSKDGGLSEAVAGFGIPFSNNNSNELALAIEKALNSYENYIKQYDKVEDYLSLRKLPLIAKAYLDNFTAK